MMFIGIDLFWSTDPLAQLFGWLAMYTYPELVERGLVEVATEFSISIFPFVPTFVKADDVLS